MPGQYRTAAAMHEADMRFAGWLNTIKCQQTAGCWFHGSAKKNKSSPASMAGHGLDDRMVVFSTDAGHGQRLFLSQLVAVSASTRHACLSIRLANS
jgi:hypothetical protein